jgi:gamma-glutamyl:cysteine ligase YbdK (ATP-grasp superfamily)
MNVFHPRTFSTDWEVMILDKLERCVSDEKLNAFTGVLRREFELPICTDWDTLELPMGINTSFEQLWGRIQAVTDRATQVVREFDLDVFPAGAHPLQFPFNASHVHVGTLFDECAGIRLENQMLPYTPAFAALAANSPAAQGRRGEYKSYRVHMLAHGCTVPASARDPQLAQNTWGSDAAPKLDGVPTMEVRITDAASSRRFLAELATFVAAYVHHCGTRVEAYRPSPDEYHESMTNRWAAARYGLQATFRWSGGARPVVEVLDEMLDGCREELAVLGIRRSDLTLIEAMIAKRVCQADFVLDLAERYPDPYCLASAYAKLVRHWTVFDEYLSSAGTLEPVPLLDEEAILAEHLAVIGEGTHFYRSRETMHLPPPAADALIEQMIERGEITREVTEKRGILLSRR